MTTKQKSSQKIKSATLKSLAEHIGAKIYRNQKEALLNEDIIITDVGSLTNAGRDHITFVSSNKNLKLFLETQAGVCITTHDLIAHAPNDLYLLVVENPYVSYIKIANIFHKEPDLEESSPSTYYISESARIGLNSRVHFGCYIGQNVQIGDNVEIHPNTYIGNGVVIGNNCIIYSNATITNTIIGDHVIIHSGARIGQDGFGYAHDRGNHIKIPHLGNVIIGNHVEIGANTCIDRGTLDSTVIGDMCKLDNLVQIGHNVSLGKGCLLVSQVGIAGSSKLGNYVTVGGQGGVAGHLKIGNNVQIAAQSGVLNDLDDKEIVMGLPAQPIRTFWRQIATIKTLINKGKK